MSLSPNRTFRRWIIVVVLLLAAGVGAWLWLGSGREPAAVYRTVAVERGPLQVSISATGTLRAISTVEIGSQISGQVISVEVDYNDEVQRGQAIAHLDPAPLRTRLTQAEADLASARASLAEAQASLVNAEADHARKQDLAGRQLVARSELDLALAARDQARARVGSARAVVAQREAARGAAELDLDYTVIRAPVDGVVLLRAVEPGQTVAASLQTPVLFEIAEDLAQMQIELTVDESDVGRIRAGQPVQFNVDAFPGRTFRGQVRQVRLAATETNNVITYPVVVTVRNSDLSLLPGMTANAEIEVDRRDDALRVPNAALRFRPADGGPEANVRAGRGPAEGELERLVEAIGPDAAQRAVFEQELAALRERVGRMPRPAGAPGAMQAGSGAPGSAAARIRDHFSGFRGSLEDGQRQRFDEALEALLGARSASLYRLQDGRPVAVQVRAGISDASHTEIVAGGLAEGDAVVVGQERSPR